MSVIHTMRLRYSNAHLVVGARPILGDPGSPFDVHAVGDDLPPAMQRVDGMPAPIGYPFRGTPGSEAR